MGAGYHGGFGNTKGSKQHNSLINENLLNELKVQQIKFTQKDIQFVTKDKSGQIVFLEQGKDSSGLTHIINRHGNDFAEKHNVKSGQIKKHLHSVFTQGEIQYSRLTTKAGKNGFEKLYKYNNKYYLLSGIGTNGYIVSAYPLDESRANILIRRYKK